jgi:hypothetical protein
MISPDSYRDTKRTRVRRKRRSIVVVQIGSKKIYHQREHTETITNTYKLFLFKQAIEEENEKQKGDEKQKTAKFKTETLQ